MNTNTLTSDTLFLTQKGQDQKIEATLHYDSQRLKATLIPKTPLSQNTDYTLHLTNEITSEKGVSSKPQTALAFPTSPTDAELKDA